MKRVFLSKYQEYCKTRDIQDEIFTIMQNDDETLEDYLERFMYICWVPIILVITPLFY